MCPCSADVQWGGPCAHSALLLLRGQLLVKIEGPGEKEIVLTEEEGCLLVTCVFCWRSEFTKTNVILN